MQGREIFAKRVADSTSAFVGTPESMSANEEVESAIPGGMNGKNLIGSTPTSSSCRLSSQGKDLCGFALGTP